MARRLEDGIRAIACALTVKAVLDKAFNRVGGILATASFLIPRERIVTKRFKAFTKAEELVLAGGRAS